MIATVMVIDADPHLIEMGLHQGSEASGLEDGRSGFLVSVSELLHGKVEFTVGKLEGTPCGLELRETVHVPRHLHLPCPIDGGNHYAVIRRDTLCRRPLTRIRALGASGGGTRPRFESTRGTGRARTTWWTEESGRARAVVERDATVRGVEVARTGDAGA
jgi:hypothetical protein